jgi:hypothetical protein
MIVYCHVPASPIAADMMLRLTKSRFHNWTVGMKTAFSRWLTDEYFLCCKDAMHRAIDIRSAGGIFLAHIIQVHLAKKIHPNWNYLNVHNDLITTCQ